MARTTRTKKSGRRKYGRGASKTVESAMRRRKHGTLRRGKRGHGGKVKSRAQAIAIGLSEAREKGEKVPPPRKGSASKRRSKSSTRKRATKRSTAKRASKGSSTKRATKRTKRASAKRRK
jgi:Family of unknown function (DUF6496)